MRQITLEGRPLHAFLVQANKRPYPGSHGYLDASTDPLEVRPGSLVAVATGAIGGIVVVDVDPRNGGDRWFHEHRSEIPTTRTHETRSDGGLHLIFRYRPGLRSCRLAAGVDFLSDGKFIVWWPSAFRRVLVEGPVAELPLALLRRNSPSAASAEGELVAGRFSPTSSAVVAEGFPAFLGNGKEGKCSRMEGPSLECIGELVDDLLAPSKWEHSPSNKTINFRRRTDRILKLVEQAKPGTRNGLLFWATCTLRNTVIAEGKLQPEVAVQLLISAATVCGLVRDDGIRSVLATIRSGLKSRDADNG